MDNTQSLIAHVVDLFAPVATVRARAMFGGHLLSADGASIGIVSGDRVYLRTDDGTRPAFEAAGCSPFTYDSKNGPMVMRSYWSLPEEAMDEPEAAAPWVRMALAAARRVRDAKERAAKERAAKDARVRRSSKAAGAGRARPAGRTSRRRRGR